ncbi:hypothetical protein BU17DRAFT_68037 [Hysterangium stoloniferum]|nr:hypothetical protein BU17DRAFT_68037 [Hysterangium stoloniferum]
MVLSEHEMQNGTKFSLGMSSSISSILRISQNNTVDKVAATTGSKMQGQKCNASAWNAFTRTEMKAVNKNLPLGQHYTLPKYIQQHYQDVKARYNSLSDEDYAALIEELCDVREDQNAIKCRQPKAVLCDVTATFQAFTHKQFCKDIFNMDCTVLLHREETTCLHGKSSCKALEGDCHNMINVGVANILLAYNIDGPAKMNYDHYETQVVRQWGVILSQWPSLQEGKCKWVKLTEAELAAQILSTWNIMSSPNNTAPSNTPNMASSYNDTSSRNPPNTVSSISNVKSSADYVMSVK